MFAPDFSRYQSCLPFSIRLSCAVFLFVALASNGIGAVETGVVEEEGSTEFIVVTAQKREESVQEVPIGITVLDGDDLTSYGISEPLAIAQFTPGVYARPTVAGSNPLFSIRGMGFNDFTSIQNPAVAVYFNQVALPYHTMMGFQLFDMQRVEILKGPQGTLYGRNSTAGAINFISNPASFNSEAYAIAEYSSYETHQFDAMANGAVSDSLAVRFALRSRQRLDSYQKNRSDDDSHFGEQDKFDGRLSFLWEVSDDVDVSLSMHSGRDKSGQVAYEHLATLDADDLNVDPCPEVAAGDRAEGPCVNLGGYFDPDNNPYHGDYNSKGRLDNKSRGGSLEVNGEFSGLTLTSVTGYEHFERYQPQDSDASPFRLIDMLYDDETKAFSQEIRVSSEDNDRYYWMVGAYYSKDEVRGLQTANAVDYYFLKFGISLDPGIISVRNNQVSRSSAIFTNLEFWLHSQWKLFGGLRFTSEQKEWEGGTAMPLRPPNLNSGTINNDEWSGNIGIEYHVSPDVMVYESLTRSYRSGGFPGGFTLSSDALQEFDQEYVHAFEVGIKSMWLDNQLIINSALYYYDWHDLQTSGTDVDSGVVSIRLYNAGDAEIYGAEVDVMWQSPEHWELGGGINWMSTEIVDTSAIELQGNDVSNAPELMFNGVARFHFDLNQLPVTLQGDVHYTDEYFFATDNEPVFKAKSLWLVNGRVTMEIPDQEVPLELALWVKNITDEEYKVSGFEQFNFSGDSYFYYGEPRTAGVSVKASF